MVIAFVVVITVTLAIFIRQRGIMREEVDEIAYTEEG